MVGDRAVKAESREREREGTDEKRTLDRDKYLFFFFFSTTRCRFSLWAERGEEKKVWKVRILGDLIFSSFKFKDI